MSVGALDQVDGGMSELPHDGVGAHRRAVVGRLHPGGRVSVPERVGRDVLFDFRPLDGCREAPPHVREHPAVGRREEQVGGTVRVFLKVRGQDCLQVRPQRYVTPVVRVLQVPIAVRTDVDHVVLGIDVPGQKSEDLLRPAARVEETFGCPPACPTGRPEAVQGGRATLKLGSLASRKLASSVTAQHEGEHDRSASPSQC